MEILDNSTIKHKIYKSSRVWVVEFYSSWCGHCHAFAPTWRRFAKQIQAWDKVVKAGVIDCAEDKNLDTCRAYEIQSFPTVKFFNAKLENESDTGVNFKGQKTEKTIRHALIKFIEKQEKLDQRPEFQPADIHAIESFTSKRTEAKILVLVFEEEESFIGKELILDTSGCKKLKVKRVLETQTELIEKYHVEEYPSMVIVDRNGSFKEVSQNNKTRKGFLMALNKIEPILKETTEVSKAPKKKKGNSTDKNGGNTELDIFMTDLVSSISFSLRREVPKVRVIKGEALHALKDWVNLLLQKFDSYLPAEVEWRSCKGSKPHYRGFPCSLWMLFHTMTVHCGTRPESGLTGLDLLRRIRGFIDFFFGCRYCRNHFVAMASNIDSEVKSFDDAILWLWERHNRVNARLASDLSTDPVHPKIQFPSEEACSECRIRTSANNTIVTSPGYGVDDIKWNKRLVLEFLKKHYGPDNIRLRDTNPFVNGENEEIDSEFVRFTCPEMSEGGHTEQDEPKDSSNDVATDRSEQATAGIVTTTK
eukprot:Seg5896.1 transcript_id=Seg5896.1/GoldUCD/mRNA.D3Y31 product="Sulfhydryl oxidase 1" protein_id=Seg5896.1/GoldUCD/D3Y31